MAVENSIVVCAGIVVVVEQKPLLVLCVVLKQIELRLCSQDYTTCEVKIVHATE